MLIFLRENKGLGNRNETHDETYRFCLLYLYLLFINRKVMLILSVRPLTQSVRNANGGQVWDN